MVLYARLEFDKFFTYLLLHMEDLHISKRKKIIALFKEVI